MDESFRRLAAEAFAKSLNDISPEIQLWTGAASPKDLRDIVKDQYRAMGKNTNKRIGRLHGGKREKKGFSWNSQRKMTFYNRVQSLPKILGRSCWEFALDVLIEKQFASETIAWLMDNSAFGNLETLFRDAVKVWRRYLHQENWEAMKKGDKPQSFEFRHALFLLEYPDKFKFSTLQTHYYVGRKLALDIQNRP